MIGKISRGKSFKQAIEYVFAQKKKALLIYSNLTQGLEAPANLKPLVRAFTSHAQFYDRTEKPVYKVAISPAQGDNLSVVNWAQMCRELLSHLGLQNHQAIAVLHQDTHFPNSDLRRPHLHIIANVVGDDGRCANLFLGLSQVGRLFEAVRSRPPVYSSPT